MSDQRKIAVVFNSGQKNGFISGRLLEKPASARKSCLFMTVTCKNIHGEWYANGPLDLCSEQESIGVARAACFEILVASVRECVQTGTHAHDLLQYDGLFDTVGASLKAFPYPRLFFQWYINLPTYFFRWSRVWAKTRISGASLAKAVVLSRQISPWDKLRGLQKTAGWPLPAVVPWTMQRSWQVWR